MKIGPLVKGIRFGFTRRRYGQRVTYTWLHYQDEQSQWQPFDGDPWPSVLISKKDLEAAADQILRERIGQQKEE